MENPHPRATPDIVPFSAGFVFVHGIGRQRPGDTLASHEAPLKKAVLRAFPSITIDTTFHDETKDAPAHAEWVITSADLYCRWLLAEARWADTFEPPEPAPFGAWIRKIQFWFVVFHFSATMLFRLFVLMAEAEDAYRQRRWRALAARVVVVLSMPLRLGWAFLWRAVTIPALLVVLRLVLRYRRARLFRSMASLMSAYLGDSFALVANPESEKAMLARVRRDYEWCRDRTGWVFLIAHSQGAALARSVLSDHGSERTSFLSLGAGIGPLHALKGGLARDAYGRALAFILVLSLQLVLTTATICFVIPWHQRIDPSTRILSEVSRCLIGIDVLNPDVQRCYNPAEGYIGLPLLISLASGALVILTAIVVPNMLAARMRVLFARTGIIEIADSLVELALPPNRAHAWVDFSSERDPVSLGTILSSVADHAFAVSNGHFALLEHTRYHRNLGINLFVTLSASSLLPPTEPGLGALTATLEREFARQARSSQRRLVISALSGLAGIIAITWWGYAQAPF